MMCKNIRKNKSIITKFTIVFFSLILTGPSGFSDDRTTTARVISRNEPQMELAVLTSGYGASADREKLRGLIENIKKGLAEGSSDVLTTSLTLSPKNLLIRKRLKRIPLERLGIFWGEPQFFNDKATAVLGLSYATHTDYFDITFVLKDAVWKISDIKEKKERTN
jgi:hypothetical protein